VGVQADKPYPKPGERVSLEMLWHDGKSPVDSPRTVQIAWLGGCTNPIGDYFSACFLQLAEQFGRVEKDPSLFETLFGFGETFQFDVPSDIISSRPQLEGMDPYGLSYVFFAVCAGNLRAAEPGDDGLPFGCFDEAGNRLGSNDFLPGYLGLYTFLERTNANPILNGLMINGNLLDPNEMPTFPRCSKDSCRKLKLKASVDPSSAETNTGLYDAKGKVMSEQMWVEYLTTGGKVNSGPRLVNDATKGWNEDNGVDYKPPEEAGKQFVFAVVRDNRGGVAWVKQAVMFE
jgi:hypothetical protein